MRSSMFLDKVLCELEGIFPTTKPHKIINLLVCKMTELCGGNSIFIFGSVLSSSLRTQLPDEISYRSGVVEQDLVVQTERRTSIKDLVETAGF